MELLELSSTTTKMSYKKIASFYELVQDVSVDVNARDSKDGLNALLKLSRNYGHKNLIHLVQPLIERGIDVNATDPDGLNALHNICLNYKRKNLIYLIRLLEENSIDLKGESKEGHTAFYLSAFKNNPAMLFNANEIIEILSKEENDFLQVIVTVTSNIF